MARMTLMDTIKDATSVLGKMAKGSTAFDPGAANKAKETLVKAAQQIPSAFETPATDPKSEALPEIWENWKDFSAKAAGMAETVASVEVDSLQGVQTAMKAIGQSCGACHKSYRIEK